MGTAKRLARYPAILTIRYPAGYPAIISGTGIQPDTGSKKRPDYPANRISGASILKINNTGTDTGHGYLKVLQIRIQNLALLGPPGSVIRKNIFRILDSIEQNYLFNLFKNKH
jgi:hypothetical protein